MRKLLIKLRILNTNGNKYSNGTPVSTGLNLYNPISWLLIIPLLLLYGIIFFYNGIIEGWNEIFN